MIVTQFSQTLLQLIGYLETKYQCSSLCDPLPDFYFQLSVQTGPPQGTCIQGLKTLVNETYGILSILLLSTSLLIFLAFNAQYGFWRRRFQGKDNAAARDRARNYLVEEKS